MQTIKRIFPVLLVVLMFTLLLSGCKSGGLFQMEADNNKPLTLTSFKGISTELTAGFPFEMKSDAKEQPIPNDAKEFITKSQRFQGNSNDMAVNVVSVKYKNDLFANLTDKEWRELLNETVEDDMKTMGQQKSIKSFKSNKEEATVDGNPALIVTITYNQGKNNMEGRCVYTIKNNEAWVVICEYKASDSVMQKRAKEVQDSIKIK